MALYLGAPAALLVLLLLGEDAVLELLPGLLVGVVELAQRLVLGLSCLGSTPSAGAELLVDLVPADLRQVVALGVEEQVLQQGLGADSAVGGSPGRSLR